MANLQYEEDDSNRAKVSTEMSTSTQLVSSDSIPTAAKEASGITCLIPTFADACKLLNTPYSCLVLDTHRRHVALPPMYLKKKKTGIEEELNAELLKYSDNLKGVPLAYDNVKLLGYHGDILDDQGYIHLNIEASFVFFKPKKGQKLKGVINKIGLTYVGCLVHGCFNASILKPREMTAEMWKDSGLAIGESLEFDVVQLDADAAGVLLIRGNLDKTWHVKLKNTHSGTDDATAESLMPADNTATEAELDGIDGTPPTKKKKKKDKDKKALEDSLVEDGQLNSSVNTGSTRTDGSMNSNGHVEKKKKKKKIEKSQESETVYLRDLPSLDSSGYLSDKGNRKRKESDEANDISLSDEMPIPKKKKKSK